jgi:DNA-directed RNA polymerase specialized sigma24 family protein
LIDANPEHRQKRKRYRYRIVRLVIDATRETTDTEDVVQDVYMSIVRDLPSFDRVCAPGSWIDRVACRSIRSFLHGKMSKTHPQLHSERHHDSPRRSV